MIAVLFFCILGTSAQAGLPASQAQLLFSQYADQTSPNSKLDINIRFGNIHEARLRAFIESGPGGDWNVDLDPLVLNFPLPETGKAWVGRWNFLEDLQPQDAIGSSWVQNKSRALNPYLSGWIGMGVQSANTDTDIDYTFAYSPLFIPSFGPGLSISDNAPATGSRFTMLPPAYVDIDGNLFPLRYRLNMSHLSEILFQNQVFVSVRKRGAIGKVSVAAWSAPSPNPGLDLDPKIRPKSDLDIIVEATPQFARENFVAFAWEPSFLSSLNLQTAYELRSQRTSVSAKFTLSKFRFGVLHSFRKDAPTGPVLSPNYDHGLVWGEWNADAEKLGLQPSLRIEQHLIEGERGNWVRPQLSYRTNNHFVASLALNILTGQDYSYFGVWRSLDSMTIGLNYIW